MLNVRDTLQGQSEFNAIFNRLQEAIVAVSIEIVRNDAP